MSEQNPADEGTINKVTDNIAKGAGVDIVLAVSINGNGRIAFDIPPNLMQADYLLKILELKVNHLIDSSLQQAKKEQSIIQKIMPKIFTGR